MGDGGDSQLPEFLSTTLEALRQHAETQAAQRRARGLVMAMAVIIQMDHGLYGRPKQWGACPRPEVRATAEAP